MTLLKTLKKKINLSRRWIIYYDDDNKIEEIRMLSPVEIEENFEGDKKVYTDTQLIEKLESVKK